MPHYDFKQLSPFDFELLIASLLSAEWGVKLEAFKSGRDGGIDLRYSNPNGVRSEIIQCKHYASSGYSKLYSALEAELPKVKKLNPTRYGVATSVGLTAANKDAIKKLFDPYILTTGDIYGQTDINLMLERHPEVEKANFKLWFTSTAILERVLHNAVHCQTDFQIDKIIAKFPLYVQNDPYPAAMKILQDNNVVVISGVPGIGKTTLAEMLIYRYLELDYRPVAITTSLAEGRKLFNKSIPQIFYFDDFLGRTFLRENQGFALRNEDAALVDFIEMIQKSPNSKLVMTTREHIFTNALMGSEKLRHSPIVEHKCILTLGHYNNFARAQILYNHIYFSELPNEYKNTLLENAFYKQILKHRNFNPRLIEWLSSYRRVKKTPPSEYQAFVVAILENPQEIWRDAFFNQISSAARSLLLFLYNIGGSSRLAQCELGWLALYAHQSKKYNFAMSEEGYNAALREIEGSFISIERSAVNFINPSVTDFLTSLLLDNKGYIDDMLASAIYFAQIIYLWSVRNGEVGVFRSAMQQNMASFTAAINRTVSRPAYEIFETNKIRALRINDISPEKRLHGLVGIAHITQSKEIWDTAKISMDELERYWNDGYIEFEDSITLIERLEKITTGIVATSPSMHDRVRSDFFDHVHACNAYIDFALIDEYAERAVPELTDNENKAVGDSFLDYAKSGVEDDMHGLTNDGGGLNSLAIFMDKMATIYGGHIAQKAAMVREHLAGYEEQQEQGADHYYDEWRESRADDRADERAIDDLFQTLK
ncbi:hypothetical protein FV232_05495 [Methylobacterium sp. WL30]|uniref:nSTAND3 domain-containing NTPase n=1 Tax=unclassified Methylobacterium TaxID=2615210 RepID=UPI0011CAF740|nr:MULTISPECIES: restriction endonuclease [unclassified Methylobacterium]TXN40621.1 hypothetical protein FV225_05670 [Methylobacterium sp. WL93]TXN51559.1 hypothetical protein FV227_07185 [Methylobacterium sp. WL119]TXN69527.1 hypothetical protein FV232_05495 [Methylobacterium sp. WL30]